MGQDDVTEVSRVERRCFANPWPASAYRRELQNPAQNFYVVLRGRHRSFESPLPEEGSYPEGGSSGDFPSRPVPRRSLLPIGLGRRHEANSASKLPIVGFAGRGQAFDEAHVTTIGIDPLFRGHGLGELLLLCVVDEAIARRANWLTLEVRVSNVSAQTLYRKYGFTVHGTRKRYYSDNNEDALIMWSRALTDAGYRADIEERRATLAMRLRDTVDQNQLSPFVDQIGSAGPA